LADLRGIPVIYVAVLIVVLLSSHLSGW
jgi:hypothetical protein